MLGGKLRISPNLPKAWKKLSYTLLWKGQKLNVTVTPEAVQIIGEKQNVPMALEIWGKEYDFEEEIVIKKDAAH